MPRSFNGTSDRIAADGATSWNTVTPYWVAMFVNGPTSTPEREFYAEASSSTTNPVFSLQSVSARSVATLVARDNAHNSKLNTTTIATVLDNTWHHLIYTDDGSGHWQVYVDGAADRSGTFTTGTTTLNQTTFGALRWNGTQLDFFNGKLAWIGKGATLLTAAQAKALSAGASPLMFGATYFWPLWGVDSPEPSLGTTSPPVNGTLTGTTAGTTYPPLSLDLLGIGV